MAGARGPGAFAALALALVLILILAAGFWPRDAAAQPRGDIGSLSMRTSTYVDDDDTVVSSSTVAVRAFPSEELTVTGRFLVDVTSSASVDVVTAATDRWHEGRAELLGGIAWADGTTTLSTEYIFSREQDWTSHNINLGAARDLFDHNLTLGVGGTFVHNAIGRAEDPNFSRSMQVYGGAVSAVWTASPDDLFSVRYSFAFNDGYQASPYRFALLKDSRTGQLIGLEEVQPERRVRHALVLLWNHHLLVDAALRSHVRGYADDWGVVSATAGSEIVMGLGKFELGGHVRGYVQRRADFYQDVYDQPRVYMTADRELSTFWDVFTGVSMGWHKQTERFREIGFDLDLTGFGFFFSNFDRLPRRYGFVADVGFLVIL